MAALIGLVLDCREPEPLAAFWADALGYEKVGSQGAYVLLVDPDRAGPRLLLQAVPEPKDAKVRMHLDLYVDDLEAEARRLEALGARRIPPGLVHEHGTSWILMADPEGNEFCVCNAAHAP
jgi:predicted enzyme related to lactoylglutathione lyase